jgi:hypothetical protein
VCRLFSFSAAVMTSVGPSSVMTTSTHQLWSAFESRSTSDGSVTASRATLRAFAGLMLVVGLVSQRRTVVASPSPGKPARLCPTLHPGVLPVFRGPAPADTPAPGDSRSIRAGSYATVNSHQPWDRPKGIPQTSRTSQARVRQSVYINL